MFELVPPSLPPACAPGKYGPQCTLDCPVCKRISPIHEFATPSSSSSSSKLEFNPGVALGTDAAAATGTDQRNALVATMSRSIAQTGTETCHPQTGQCPCPPGATGLDCGQLCPKDRYGPDCAQVSFSVRDAKNVQQMQLVVNNAPSVI